MVHVLSAHMDVPAGFGMTVPKFADDALASGWTLASRPRRTALAAEDQAKAEQCARRAPPSGP